MLGAVEEVVREIVDSWVVFRGFYPLLRDKFDYVAFGFANGGADAVDARKREENGG